MLIFRYRFNNNKKKIQSDFTKYNFLSINFFKHYFMKYRKKKSLKVKKKRGKSIFYHAFVK